jgi:hypothetical protein
MEIAAAVKPVLKLAASDSIRRDRPSRSAFSMDHVLRDPLNKDPAILEISPCKGSLGDIITIAAINLNPDPSWSEVHFTISPQLDLSGKIVSFAQSDAGFTIEVEVPNSNGASQAFNGQVYFMSLDRQPVFRTNSVPFRFEPIILPRITSVNPCSGTPDDLVSVSGTDFAPDAGLHFIVDQGQDMPVVADYQSEELITCRVPEYNSDHATTAQIFVQRQCGGGWMRSNVVFFDLKPTLPTILSFDPVAGGPRDPLLIRGAGFSNPEVHFVIKPGKDLVMPVDYWNDTTILTAVPDVDGIPEACNVQVYLKCGSHQSALQTFRFIPETVLQVLDTQKLHELYKYDFSFQAHNDEDSGFFFGSEELSGYHVSDFIGHKDDDELFSAARLKNGWVVDSVTHALGGWGGHGSFVKEDRIGTDSPYVKVHWWVDPVWSEIVYHVSIYISGPKGVPYL